MPLTPCADISVADWLVAGDRPWHRLVGIGPPGLPAYARLRFLPDPTGPGQRESDADPVAGALGETEQLRIVLDTLAGHTRTPGECYFCFWDGWGHDLVPGAPTIVVPHRAYHLFRGALADFGDRGPAGSRSPYVPDPAFVWPADRAWCVARDVDPHWAGIGADRSAVDRLMADPRLDVVAADPDEDPPAYR